MRASLWILVFVLATASAAHALEVRVVDARTGAFVAGATVTLVGRAGAATTDSQGRFAWTPDPPPPFVVVIVLSGGHIAKPVVVEQYDRAAVLTLVAEAALVEHVTIAGVAPSITPSPAAGATLISRADIASRAPATVSEALANVPGLGLVSEGQGAVPAIRGLARGRTVVLLDGTRVLTERRAGANASFLDPAGLDRIDVARGPGSVAYGSDAFGGVISVRSREPDFTAPLHVNLTALAGAGVPDRRVDLEVSKGFGIGAMLVRAHDRHAGDYHSPDTRIPNSGWRDRGLFVRLDRRVGPGSLWAVWRSDFGRHLGRPRSDVGTVRVSVPFEDSHRFTASYRIPGARGVEQATLTGLIGFSSQRTDQDRVQMAARPRTIERSDISARDFQVRATASRSVRTVRLDFGVDTIARTGVEATDTTLTFTPGGDVAAARENFSIASAGRLESAGFAQGELALSRTVRASAGGRLTILRTTNKGGFFGTRSVAHTAAAGLAAVTFTPGNGMSLTAQVSRGFREPTVSDRFHRGPVGRGFIVGNPDLSPETSLQFDVAARYTASRLRIAGYYYSYRIDSLIELYPASAEVFHFRNRGRAHLQGTEVELQADAGRGFALEAAGAFGAGATADRTPLDDVAAPSLSVGVAKRFGERLTCNMRASAAARHDDPGPTEVDAPGYVRLDAGMRWRVARRLELRAHARNLLDQRYYASVGPRWVYAAGRSGWLGFAVGLR